MAKKKSLEQYEYKDKAERLAMLKKTAREINKEHNLETLHFGNEHRKIVKLPVDFPEIDKLLGGGIPYGNFFTAWGAPGCLAGFTEVPFVSKTKSGNFKAKKNKKIDRLYEIFNNIPNKKPGKYIGKESIGVDYFLPSVKEDGTIFLNKINNVVFSGNKFVYQLKTKNGHVIYATEDHKFLTEDGYKKLNELNIGDILMFHPKKPITKGGKKRKLYSETTVKYHPFGIKKNINGYICYRIPLSHLTVEAKMNNMSLEAFRYVLNTDTKLFINKNFNFVNTKTHEVHHKNRNTTDNDLNNLQLLTKKEHHLIHINDSIKNLSIKAEKTTIKSIIPYEEVPTYDITMSNEYPNFCAEGLFVHNSGKSTLAHMLTASAQKEGKLVYYIALEPYDQARAIQFGVKVDTLLIGEFPQAEQSLDTIIEFARKKLVDVIILDSIHSLSPKGEQEDKKGEKSIASDTMALLARKLSQFFKIAIDPIKRANIAVFMIGQTRMDLGGFIPIQKLTGGNALHHYSKGIIKINRGQRVNAPSEKKAIEGKLTPSGKQSYETIQTGFECVIKVDKCQIDGMSTEGTELRLPYYYESGFYLPEKLQQEIEEEEKEIAEQEGKSEEATEKVKEEVAKVTKKRGRPKKGDK